MGDIKPLGESLLQNLNSEIQLGTLKRSPVSLSGEITGKDPEKAAAEFESLLVGQMMKTMWDSVPKSGLFSGGYEADMYQEMLQQELSSFVGEHQSLGIRDMVLKELKEKGNK
ncbi:MAG: rod-binding protein [Bdellovibrionales bacterium]|nr:rod-binding protein [Bdellovibrionales bacterium]